MKHMFGVVIFVPIGVKKIDAFEIEKDDPFCYHCGQKLMNIPIDDVTAEQGCPGPSKHSSNVRVYSG